MGSYTNLNENQFLIARAIGVFNVQYGKQIDPADCQIAAIPPDGTANRGYEITTPSKSSTFRLRYYFKFGSLDLMTKITLETSGDSQEGVLGDEVYVLNGSMDESWRWMGPFKFEPFTTDIPYFAIVTENGDPIVTENDAFILSELAR